MTPTTRLLLVDDNPHGLFALCERLKKSQFEVVTATDGYMALELLNRQPFDVMLLDIMMPGLSGFDVLAAVRKRFTAVELPVLMVTAKDDTEDVVRALGLGANDYLTKPVDYAIAVARINTCVTIRRAEQALRQSEERYALAIQGANDGLWDWDVLNDILYISPRGNEIIGEGQLAATLPSTQWLARIHPADREHVQADLASHFNRTTPYLQSEHRILHEDSSYRWILWRGLAVRDMTGRPYRMAGSITDITESKIAAIALQHANTELTAVNQELEAFSYSVSHDLRAPLRTIDGLSLAVLEDYSDALAADGRDLLERVRAAAQRMGHLIDDLLKLSRVTRTDLQRDAVNLSILAEAVIKELRDLEPERNVSVTIAPDIFIAADARLMRIVLDNLLGNAWKFTSATQHAEIEFGAENHEGTTAYFVKDNGAGFNMEYADRLFGAFQRLHTNAEFPGTGIGLATVSRIVRRHGGEVWAKSSPGNGATFYFTVANIADLGRNT